MLMKTIVAQRLSFSDLFIVYMRRENSLWTIIYHIIILLRVVKLLRILYTFDIWSSLKI